MHWHRWAVGFWYWPAAQGQGELALRFSPGGLLRWTCWELRGQRDDGHEALSRLEVKRRGKEEIIYCESDEIGVLWLYKANKED